MGLVVGNLKWCEVKMPNYLYLRNWTRNKCKPTYTWCEREGILKELSARLVRSHALYYVVLRGRMPPAPAPGRPESDERCPDLPMSPPKAPGASADRPGFKPLYRVTHGSNQSDEAMCPRRWCGRVRRTSSKKCFPMTHCVHFHWRRAGCVRF